MKFYDSTRSTIRFSFNLIPLTYFTQYTTVWFSFLLTFHINIDNENVSSSESYMNHPPPHHTWKNIITVLCSNSGPNKNVKCDHLIHEIWILDTRNDCILKTFKLYLGWNKRSNNLQMNLNSLQCCEDFLFMKVVEVAKWNDITFHD